MLPKKKPEPTNNQVTTDYSRSPKPRTNKSWYYSNVGHPHREVDGRNIPVEQDYVDKEAEYKRYYDNYGNDRY